MSNNRITGFGDRNRTLSDSDRQTGAAPEEDVFMQNGPLTDPRDEGFFEMLRVNVSPNLHCFSFAVILVYVLLIIFAVQVGVDRLVLSLLAKDFLPVNDGGPFAKHLVLIDDHIRVKYQVWRYFTALFLHENAMRLLSSIVSLLIWASLFERLISPLKIMLYYFLGGILGYMFATAVTAKGTVLMGASPGIFAIFGGSLGFLIYNWKNMEKVPSRLSWMLIVIFIMVFSLLFSNDHGNLFKQLGGFLAGLSVGMAFSDKYIPKGTVSIGRTSHESIFLFLGIAFVGLLFITCLTLVLFTK